jgi:hypothetical protein
MQLYSLMSLGFIHMQTHTELAARLVCVLMLALMLTHTRTLTLNVHQYLTSRTLTLDVYQCGVNI